MGFESQGRKILLANVDGQYYAIGGICTHLGCILSDGKLSGDKIQCPCHGSVFNIKTGEVIQGPARKPEPTYKLKIEGDQILLIG
jgi:nitrite reductase/ring-hydroxylating ferredoxin subunit